MSYFFIGIIVTLISIFVYRNDGQTKKYFELYFAILGVLLWPLQIIMWIKPYFINNKKTEE